MTVVFWDLTANAPDGTLVRHDAAAKELDQVWSDLASEDAAKAGDDMASLPRNRRSRSLAQRLEASAFDR